MPRLISRAEFSRIAGVTDGAITRACKADLAPACHGTRLDVAHPAAQAYLARKGAQEPPPLSAAAARARTTPGKLKAHGEPVPPARKRGNQKKLAAPPEPRPAPQANERVQFVSGEISDVSKIADMTIRQVVNAFGTVTAFRDWLAALRTIEEVREKNLRNAEADGNVISIRLVQTHVMGAIESGNRRLLTDSPKTIARKVYAAAKSDIPIEEAEQLVRDIISSQLKPMKDAVAKSLRKNDE